jgi:hypothetical protein
VVLDDVAGGADAVVVAGAAADPDVLRHGDLHVVDVVGVPDRLEHRVGEAQRQDVLHRLLAEVVVDPEDRAAREDVGESLVQLTGRGLVVAERLLHHDAAPRPLTGPGQVVLLELTDHVAEEPWRDRQVERVVAVGAASLVELLDGAPERAERRVVVEVAGHEAEALGQLVPHLLAELGPGVLLHRVVDDLGEVLVRPVTPREPGEAEPGRQQAPVGEVVDRRHHLLPGQVAGDPEQHQPAWSGDPGEPAVERVAERVGPWGGAARRAHGRRCSR